MNQRENALANMKFNNPEYVNGGPPCYEVTYFGCNHEGFDGSREDGPVGSTWTDVWGTVWRKEQQGCMGLMVEYPLATSDKLNTYQWPDPNDERLCSLIYQQKAGFPGGDLFLAGQHRDTLWEKAYMLVGMEAMMVAFYEEPEFAREVLHRIMDFQLGIARHYLRIGVEMIHAGDDLGTQRGPLLSPAIVQEFLVPEYRRLFELYRQKGIYIGFHSCGNIEWATDIFIDLGIDILNPVQATANDLALVSKKTHGKLALQGGVSTETIMKGPIEAIERETRLRLWQLGRQGGYFCSPDQGMPFPQEHIDAFWRTVEEYGRYPLQPFED